MFDYVHKKQNQDMTSVGGFLLALQGVLRLKRQALCWIGLPCHSFTWMCSSQHKRSESLPLGATHLPFVASGNLLAARSVLLALICSVRGVYYFIEQPAGSLLDHYPYVSWLFQLGDGLQPSMVRWQPVYSWINVILRFRPMSGLSMFIYPDPNILYNILVWY